jgi:hypothetical protein
MPYMRVIPPSNLGLVIAFLSEIYEEFPQILKLIPGRLNTLLSHDSLATQICAHDRKFCEFCYAILHSRRDVMIRDFRCVWR